MRPIPRLFIPTITLMLCSALLWSQDLHHLHKDLPCLNKNYNVYAHVTFDQSYNTNYSEEELIAILEVANEHFAPICVSFTLCSYDTIVNYNFDAFPSLFELDVLFKHDHRINLYLVGALGRCGVTSGNSIALVKGCNGIALTHELGHLFGLLHTFTGNGEENVDGSNCEIAGDNICDTPADPYDPSMVLPDGRPYYRGCEFIYNVRDANGDYYQPDIGNIMSYYPCRCGFTRGQYLRLVENIESGKIELW